MPDSENPIHKLMRSDNYKAFQRALAAEMQAIEDGRTVERMEAQFRD